MADLLFSPRIISYTCILCPLNAGIELATIDIVAIARLRGPRLRRLDISLSCLMHSVSDDDADAAGLSYSVPFCHLREEEKYDFYVQVSRTRDIFLLVIGFC